MALMALPVPKPSRTVAKHLKLVPKIIFPREDCEMIPMQYLRAFVLASVIGLLLSPAFPQSSITNEKSRNVLLRDIPGFALSQVHALGDRVSRSGKEVTVLDGRFLDQSGNTTAVRVVLELPQSVEISGLKPGSSVLRFDSALPAIPTDPDDAVLLETFSTDTAEGFLASIKDGALAEIVGYGIVPSGVLPANSASAYDVFQVRSPVKSRSDRLTRTKLYYFDSEKGYLMRTLYDDGRNEVEVRFSGWRQMDGSAYPGRIERYVNNQLLFSFEIVNVTARPLSDGIAHR